MLEQTGRLILLSHCLAVILFCRRRCGVASRRHLHFLTSPTMAEILPHGISPDGFHAVELSLLLPGSATMAMPPLQSCLNTRFIR